ncbi:MAG TPA: hypothetical protein VGI43_17370 [Mucilaginibacter sp.]|jgi:hypothetical protein
MKIKSCFISTAILLIVLASCKENNTAPAITRTADVYIAGFTTAGNNITVATYWKNGTATTLGNTKANSILNSIVIQNTDVYVAGTYTAANGKKVAAYWKNNQITKLSDSTADCAANSIFISGTDVYVGGALNGIAAYWKNGTPTQLPDYALESVANSIFVQGNNIFLVGNLTNAFGLVFAAFWENGQVLVLPPTDVVGSTANAIVLDNNNVINVAGGSYASFINGVNNVLSATYWNGSGSKTLGDKKSSSNATGIAINGNEVFISGNITAPNGAPAAVYWNNGVENFLTNGASYSDSYGIALDGNDVYITGDNLGGHATYWKNGVAVKLSNTVSSGHSIAVVKL